MGVYIYSLRAKTVRLRMPSYQEVRANLYSYAYRQSSVWRGDYGYRSYNLTVENTKRNAELAFATSRSGIVIVGDMKARGGLDGDCVYTDVTASQWWDCERFPGTFIGWVEKVGREYRVTDRTKWSECRVLRGDQWVPVRTRSVLIDGKVTQEQVDIVSVAIGSEAHCELDRRLELGEQIDIEPAPITPITFNAR